jgi:hypothetical protein
MAPLHDFLEIVDTRILRNIIILVTGDRKNMQPDRSRKEGIRVSGCTKGDSVDSLKVAAW